MKRNFKVMAIAAFLIITPLFMFAQPHPNGGNNPNGGGTTNAPVGPSAPVGNGTFILVAMALAYAGRKVYILPSPEEK